MKRHREFMVILVIGFLCLFTPDVFASGMSCCGSSSSGTAEPAGENKEVQYNDNGAFGADSSFSFDVTTKVVSAPAFRARGGQSSRIALENGYEINGDASTYLRIFSLGYEDITIDLESTTNQAIISTTSSVSAIALGNLNLSMSGDISTAGYMVFPTPSQQQITAVGSTITADSTVIVLNPDGNYTLTSAPTIRNGDYENQLVMIRLLPTETNTIVLQDSHTLANSNMQLSAASITLSSADVATFLWDGTDWNLAAYLNN